jgi:hypothetical protein
MSWLGRIAQDKVDCAIGIKTLLPTRETYAVQKMEWLLNPEYTRFPELLGTTDAGIHFNHAFCITSFMIFQTLKITDHPLLDNYTNQLPASLFEDANMSETQLSKHLNSVSNFVCQ